MSELRPLVPNFLFIGPDKTGSSWLYKVLRAHPDCFVPAAKDLYYFDRYYERGADWYLSHFQPASPDAVAIGELSHDYLFSPEAAQRIARDLPQAQLLTILRDPVERTYSHYLYIRMVGRTDKPFEEALELFPEMIENSLYAKHLAAYFDTFPQQRLTVLSFDELQRDPAAFAAQVYAALGLRWIDSDLYAEKTRAAAEPRSAMLSYWLRRTAWVVRDAGFANLVGRIKNSRAASWLQKPYAPEQKPQMRPETRARLQKLFAEDSAALRRMLQTQGNLQRWPWLAAGVSGFDE